MKNPQLEGSYLMNPQLGESAFYISWNCCCQLANMSILLTMCHLSSKIHIEGIRCTFIYFVKRAEKGAPAMEESECHSPLVSLASTKSIVVSLMPHRHTWQHLWLVTTCIHNYCQIPRHHIYDPSWSASYATQGSLVGNMSGYVELSI